MQVIPAAVADLATRAAPDVVTVGECLVALVAAEPGPLEEGHALIPYVAGAEANAAVGLARLGRSVAYVGRVGDDGLGRLILRRLRGEGVDVTHLRADPGAPTGVLLRDRRTLVASDVIYHRRGSAGSRLSPDDVRAATGCFRGARWLHLTGITPALSPSAREAVEVALDLAREHALTISLDVNLRRKLWSETEAREVLRSLARRVDVVLAGREEAELLGEDVAGPGTDQSGVLVLKLGSDGSTAVDHAAGERVTRPGFGVPSVVDPIGAGDAFAGGFIAARLGGHDLGTALEWGNACGAVAVTARGDMTGLPTLRELQESLAGRAEDARR
jgi:2-dehydro-3-deoxygluconokinase